MNRGLNTLFYNQNEIHYDGAALSPHWIYRQFDLMGDTLVAFIGSANVSLDHMVDLEDVKKSAPIYSPKMLHFIGEWFLDSLDVGILLQHLLMNEIYELLLEKKLPDLHRRGNDLFFQSRKLSVSIATRSNVSVLIHAAINIDTEGTPIPTAGLRELNLDATTFAKEVLERFARDAEIWHRARVKVLPR